MPIQTVLGPVHRDELGIVSPHEHIFIDLSAFFEEHPVPGAMHPAGDLVTMERLGILRRDPYALRDNLILDDFTLQRQELLAFRNAGGRTVADATLDGIGRDVRALRRISEETGLHIIAGTGYYVGATHPRDIGARDDEEIARHFIAELREGIQGTDIRAGFIGEIGVSERFEDRERKVLRAAAIAQRETGVGIEVHVNPWTTNGLEAAHLLLELGVAPEKIVICHVDVENRRPYIDSLLALGVFIEFDNFGKEYFVDAAVRRPGYGCFARDTERVRLLAALIEKGYVRQILLCCDICLKTLLCAYGGWGYGHVLTNVAPMLLEAGVVDGQLDIMLRENPSRFFDA